MEHSHMLFLRVYSKKNVDIPNMSEYPAGMSIVAGAQGKNKEAGTVRSLKEETCAMSFPSAPLYPASCPVAPNEDQRPLTP